MGPPDLTSFPYAPGGAATVISLWVASPEPKPPGEGNSEEQNVSQNWIQSPQLPLQPHAYPFQG
jgi:hypothetical protein